MDAWNFHGIVSRDILDYVICIDAEKVPVLLPM
jgi:hypothetical protein